MRTEFGVEEDKLRVPSVPAVLPVPIGLADPFRPGEADSERCRPT